MVVTMNCHRFGSFIRLDSPSRHLSRSLASNLTSIVEREREGERERERLGHFAGQICEN